MTVFHGLLALALGQACTPDETARNEALRIIEAARTEEHRECWEVTIPYEPSGLPDSYEIRLGGGYIDRQLVSVEMRREPGEAWGEMLTKEGVRRGPIPVDVVDRFASVALYLKHAAHAERLETIEYEVNDDGTVTAVFHGSGGGVRRSHTIAYEFQLSSREDSQVDARIAYPREHALLETIAPEYDVERFTFTWTVRGLLRLADEHLQPVPVSDQLKQEILARFSVPTDSEEPWPRPSLFAYLLYRWRVVEAVVAMSFRGFEDHAHYLAAAAASDPTAFLVDLLCSDDTNRALWALDFVAQEATPPVRRKALLDTLHCVESDDVLRFVLAEVCVLESDAEILGMVRPVLDRPELSVRAAVSARRTLYALTRDRQHFDAAFAKAREDHVGEKDPLLEAAKDLVQVRPQWPLELLQILADRFEKEGASEPAVRELRDAPPPKPRESLSGFDW